MTKGTDSPCPSALARTQRQRLPHLPDEEFEDEFDDEFDEPFELEFDELLELEFEDEFDELFELEFELELDELLPARMIWPVSPVTLCVPALSGFATGIAAAAVAPRPRANALVRITLRFMMSPFVNQRNGLMRIPSDERMDGATIPDASDERAQICDTSLRRQSCCGGSFRALGSPAVFPRAPRG